jgi:type II secretory pathway predicted ATPase ExeA
MESASVDYLQHFGLDREPFGSDPLPGFHFECASQQGAERRLARGPLHGKGLSVLVGGYGSGKTTVLRRLVDALPANRFEAAVMVMVRRDVDPLAFLQRVARLFGVNQPPDERGALIGQLAGRLGQIQERGLRALAVIDEAHLIRGDDVLDELRGLLSLEGEQGRTLSLVLAGLPELEATLARHRGLGSRVDVKVRLEPFDADTSARYLAERLAFARGKPDVLHPAAVAAIHEHARGVPRVLNTLADNALHEAFLAGRGALTVTDVERAAADLAVEASPDLETAEVLSPVEVEGEPFARVAPVEAIPGR